MKKKDTEIYKTEETNGFETDVAESAAEKTDSEISGVYVYVGPTVKGIVTNGSIMGTKIPLWNTLFSVPRLSVLKQRYPRSDDCL